jgi:hypothetical protein
MTVTAAATEVEGSTVISSVVITSRTAVICACSHYASVKDPRRISRAYGES